MHSCPIEGCGKKVPTFRLMCPKHWGMVSAPLQRSVWNHWQKDTAEYPKFRQAAIDEVHTRIAAASRPAVKGGQLL